MKLRDYQHRAIADLRAVYAAGRRAPVLVLPTGGGKTIVAAEVIRSAVARGRRVLFLAHRRELIDQAQRKLELAGIHDVRTIRAASDLGSRHAPVTVASVQTLTGWPAERYPAADLVVLDECHHVVARTWRGIADRYATAHLLGLTATPQRADGAPLGDVFDALVVGATVAELTALGHLVRCRTWAPHQTLDTGRIALTPAEAYDLHGCGERAVVFCGTKQHAAEIAATIDGAAVVHGSMPSSQRAAVLAAFASGAIRVVVNVHVLTEGWDDPGCAVCILVRKPQHAGTYLQMVGRVLRPAPGKTHATVIDLCGSSRAHGTADVTREYSLDGKGIRRTDRDAIRQCTSCGSVFLSAPICPECGRSLAVTPAALPRSIGVGLTEVAPATPPRPMPPRVIESKYPGTCRVCSGGVRVGQRVAWAKGTKPAHEMCWVNEIMARVA